MQYGAVQTLPRNTSGRDFVVGDIHGCFSVLEKAMKKAGFNHKKDRLISVGDLVNKGPQSERALDFLKHDWVYAVRGNHDEAVATFAQRAKDGTFKKADLDRCKNMGADWILNPKNKKLLKQIRTEFSALPYAIEIETGAGKIGIVHAEVPLGMDWETFKKQLAKSVKRGDDPFDLQSVRSQTILGRARINGEKTPDKNKVQGLKKLFVGHTPQRDGCTNLGNIFYIDTAAASDNFLTLVNIQTKRSNLIGAKTPKGLHQIIDFT